jgi:hypothetical protein
MKHPFLGQAHELMAEKEVFGRLTPLQLLVSELVSILTREVSPARSGLRHRNKPELSVGHRGPREWVSAPSPQATLDTYD